MHNSLKAGLAALMTDILLANRRRKAVRDLKPRKQKVTFSLMVCAVAATISACAPSVTGGNSAGISFNNVQPHNNLNSLFEQAEAHCQQHGKVARAQPNTPGDGIISYDCVE